MISTTFFDLFLLIDGNACTYINYTLSVHKHLTQTKKIMKSDLFPWLLRASSSNAGNMILHLKNLRLFLNV